MDHLGLKKRDGKQKLRYNQKNAINDFAKLRHPQPRSLLSLGTMDSENWFCGNKR